MTLCEFVDDDGQKCTLAALEGGDGFCELHAAPRGHELGRYGRPSPRPRRPFASTAPRVLDVQALLPFEVESDYTLSASPQKPFKPLGLMLWDVGTLSVQAIVIGARHQLVVAFGLVPARWFTVAQSFEQVVAAFAEGKQPGQGWGTWDDFSPGLICRLSFDGPARGVQALMWGLST